MSTWTGSHNEPELEEELARYRAEHPGIGVKPLITRILLEHVDWSGIDTKRVREALRSMTTRQSATVCNELRVRGGGLMDVTELERDIRERQLAPEDRAREEALAARLSLDTANIPLMSGMADGMVSTKI